MTMKKKYITPELEIIEIGLDGTLICTSTSVGMGGEENDGFARDNYDDNTPSRPGSGNVWDQDW